MGILKQGKVKRCKDSMIISENNNRCTVNDFFFACSFIFSFLSKSSNSSFQCDNLYRIHNICKYFEFVSVHIQK